MSRILKLTLHAPEEEVVFEAARVVTAGGLLVYPTETLYGIGGDARNAEAVEKVERAKRRSERKPILVLVHSAEMLDELVEEIPSVARHLMDRFWPGPLTIVFKAAAGVLESVTRGSGTVGVRLPSSVFCLELLRRCGCPLTSTSANLSGQPVHRTMDEIVRAVSGAIDLYLDAGELPESKPSTVVSVAAEQPILIREGVISFDTLQQVLPTIKK